MTTKIEKGSYGNYSSDNYGANTIWIKINDLTIYFSYDTVVAFEYQDKFYCSENVWSKTTGKHLNWIEPRHNKRIEYLTFIGMLKNNLKINDIDFIGEF